MKSIVSFLSIISSMKSIVSFKNEEIVEFQNLLMIISAHKVSSGDDSCKWSLEPSGLFSFKFLTGYLKSSSPLDSSLFVALWKSRCP